MVGGFLGGAASGLIKPLRDVSHFMDLFDGHHNTALIGAAVMGFLGCVVVWLFQEGNVKKALSMCLGLPAFITNVGATLSSPEKEPSVAPVTPAMISPAPSAAPAVGWLSIFAPSMAHAQEPAAPAAGPPNLSIELNSNKPVAYQVDVLDASEKKLTHFDVTPANSAFVAHPLPSEAAKLRFSAPGSDDGAVYPIKRKPGESTVQVDVVVREEKQVGFAQVFGAPATTMQTLSFGFAARAKTPAGKQGWVFCGTWTGTNWKSLHISLPGNGLPAPGDEGVVTYPLNMRPAAGKGEGKPLGVLSAGQKVRVDEVAPPKMEGPTWVRVTVLSDEAPPAPALLPAAAP